jgi:hypothetical protein
MCPQARADVYPCGHAGASFGKLRGPKCRDPGRSMLPFRLHLSQLPHHYGTWSSISHADTATVQTSIFRGQWEPTGNQPFLAFSMGAVCLVDQLSPKSSALSPTCREFTDAVLRRDGTTRRWAARQSAALYSMLAQVQLPTPGLVELTAEFTHHIIPLTDCMP